MDRSNRSHKISFLKNFAKLTGKHLYQSLFFNKVAGLRQIFSCEFGEISKNSFFKPLRFFLLFKFYLHFWAVTFFGPAFDFIQWPASVVSRWTSTSFFSNTFRTFPSRSLSVTDSRTPDISKHSRVEYCSFAQHWCSTNFIFFILSHTLVFTCSFIIIPDPTFS